MNRNVPALTLYGTAGCHLCESAAEVLRLASLSPWHEIDIAADDALLARYGTRIPVVRCEPGGHELGWPFDVFEVRALCNANSGSAVQADPLQA